MKKVLILLLFVLVIYCLKCTNENMTNNQRYPNCIESDKLALRVFNLLEKHGKLDQTHLMDAYSILICLYDELKEQNCSEELMIKYYDQLKTLKYKDTESSNSKVKNILKELNIELYKSNYYLEKIITGCVFIIELSSCQLKLFSDDSNELANLNKLFYKRYLNEIQKLDNC